MTIKTTAIPAMPVDSKQQEIDFIVAVASATPANTRLASLWTEDMLLYLSGQIKSDFQCDVLGDMQRVINEKIKSDFAAQAAQNANRTNTANLTAMIEKIQAEAKAERDASAKHILSMQLCIERMQAERNEAERLLYKAQIAADIAQDQVIKLKAKLFDAMMANQ